MGHRPSIAVHKFSSCDGCQLALLNLGEALLALPQQVDILHFAEAGMLDEQRRVDVALVEGSINTEHDRQRIHAIRANSRTLIVLGACATAGGIQALRNLADAQAWTQAIYARPEHLDSLPTASAIADHVKVDIALWGCPVNSKQLLAVLRDLLFGVQPYAQHHPLCMECKRLGQVCTLVSTEQACMGPVTRAGCGALCPSFGRACYACYGPAEKVNGEALGRRLEGFGLLPEELVRRFRFINSGASAFQAAARKISQKVGKP